MNEVGQIAGLLFGIGMLGIFIVGMYMFYQVARLYKFLADKKEAYSILEIAQLKNTANKKGIDLNKEIMKSKLMNTKSFEKKMEEEIMKDFFENKSK